MLKLTVERDVLASAAEFTAAELTRSPLPQLSAVRLRAAEHSCALLAFDGDTLARDEVPATVHTAGEAAVSATLLLKMVRLLEPGPVSVVCEASWSTRPRRVGRNADGSPLTEPVRFLDGVLLLEQGDVSFTLPLIDMADAPELPAEPGLVLGSVTADELRAVAAQVLVCAGADPLLPVLTAVQVRAADGRLRWTATDRYRLGTLDAGAAADTGPDPDREPGTDPDTHPVGRPGSAPVRLPALLPAAVLRSAAKRLTGGDAGAVLTLVGGPQARVALRRGGRTLSVRVVDGGFPKVEAVFPTGPVATFTCSGPALLAALKKLAPCVRKGEPLTATPGEGTLTVAAGGAGGPTARCTVPATVGLEPGAQLPAAFGVSPAFLADGVKAVGGTEVRIGVVDAAKPLVLTGGSGLRYLVMPVRLSG